MYLHTVNCTLKKQIEYISLERSSKLNNRSKTEGPTSDFVCQWLQAFIFAVPKNIIYDVRKGCMNLGF